MKISRLPLACLSTCVSQNKNAHSQVVAVAVAKCFVHRDANFPEQGDKFSSLPKTFDHTTGFKGKVHLPRKRDDTLALPLVQSMARKHTHPHRLCHSLVATIFQKQENVLFFPPSEVTLVPHQQESACRGNNFCQGICVRCVFTLEGGFFWHLIH